MGRVAPSNQLYTECYGHMEIMFVSALLRVVQEKAAEV